MISYISRLLNEEDEDEAKTIVFASLATLLFFAGLMWWFMTGNAPTNNVVAETEDKEIQLELLCKKGTQRDAYGQCAALPALAQSAPTTTSVIVASAEKPETAQVQIKVSQPALVATEIPDAEAACAATQGVLIDGVCQVTIDSDADGLADESDECPDQVGPADNAGCPRALDQDSDGTPDEFDKCLAQPGPADNEGCPVQIDDDFDGTANDLDNCPTEAGPASNNGCPVPADSDGDGIDDDEDKCPQTAGAAQSNGCPPPTPAPIPAEPVAPVETVEPVSPVEPAIPATPVKVEKTELQTLADAVVFDSASAELNESSKRALQRVAAIVREVPGRKLKVTAHTDSSGEATYNLALSHKRALACLVYLRSLGLERELLSGIGLGETQPRATNINRAGRRLNRRVEFSLINP